MIKTASAVLGLGAFIALAMVNSAFACGANQSAMSKPVVTASGKTPQTTPTSQTPKNGG